MTGRTIIIIVVGIIITTGTVLFRIEASSTNIVANVGQYYRQQTARNIAQTGVNMGLRQLSDYSNWRTGIALIDVLDGKTVVTALDTMFNTRQVVRIQAIGIISYGTSLETRDTSTAYVAKGFGPITVKAAAVTNAATKFGGGVIADGRDHDTSGNLIANNGILAAWSTNTISGGGSSSFGGTTGAGVDVKPKGKLDTSIVHGGQTWSGGFPTTPDGVAGGTTNGYPEGTLKTIAQSGQGGSQWVTDPSLLTYPLKGVTYVELPSGTPWIPKAMFGSGILIVHNTAGNAILKSPSGTFTGLLIFDDITNLSGATILGAMVQMSPTPTSDLFGTSNGSITFSRAAILNATNSLQSTSNGSAANVIAWWE